jgi:IS1 family transposase
MANVLKKDRQLQVLHMLCEGNSIRSIERLTGVQKKTVCRLLVRFGYACQEMLDEEMRGLELKHIQCDEIWTYVLKKEGRIRIEDKHHSSHLGDQFLFIALDQETKLIPCYAIGKRNWENTRRFIADLSGRIVLPPPSASDVGGYKPITQISTDAFAGYRPAIDLSFGHTVLYGQLVKDYRNAEQPGRYAAPEMVAIKRIGISRGIDPYSICTSHVERQNLTIRTFMRRFTRLSLGFSKKLENLGAAVALHVAHYNYCRRHNTLRVTPAMAANVTGTLWSIENLYDRVMP